MVDYEQKEVRETLDYMETYDFSIIIVYNYILCSFLIFYLK